MKFIKKRIFLKKFIRNLKTKFKYIYKIDYYGSYHLDMKKLVLVIVFEKEDQLLNYKSDGKTNSITQFCKTYLNYEPNILFITKEFIKKNYAGNYWSYYKSL